MEELLRYASPLETATERYAREDVTIAGVTIPRGALVFAALASANRDERQFPDPDRAGHRARAEPAPVRSGSGPTTAWARRSPGWRGRSPSTRCCAALPDLRLAVAPGAVRWRRGLVLRGLESLPVALSGL